MATSPDRGATRDDVARLAGVSSAVVSYVVNNGPRPVAEGTRARVLDAIETLGYRPNAAARSLIRGRADLIGLIVPDVGNPYFAALARAVETAARAEGVNVVLAQGSGSLAPLIEALSGHLVAGVISAATPDAGALAALARTRMAMVRLSMVPPGADAATVLPDFYSGARQAVRHLIEAHGHRRVALLMGADPGTIGVLDDRERGWRDALREAGLPDDAVVRAPWSAAGGRAAADRLLDAHPGVTAAFVSSDQQAVGLLSGLHARGVGVPGDLALVSFDGAPEAEFTVPPLTTVSVPMAQMAASAVRQLLHDEAAPAPFEPTLILRRSCGCLR